MCVCGSAWKRKLASLRAAGAARATATDPYDHAMPVSRLSAPLVEVAARNMMVDRITAETVRLFTEAGIECMLIKGPVIEDALYGDTVRPYRDCDLLVARSNWERAIAVLVGQGFQDRLGPMAHPRMESFAGTAFARGVDNVDLHCTLAGLDASPEKVWRLFWASARRREVGGQVVAVPDRSAMLLHLALHVAHHPGQDRPLEDLRRGIQQGSLDDWRQAADLAQKLSGLAAFATGLRSLAEGSGLARTLGIEHVRSVQFELRIAGVPTAEGLNQLLAPDLTLRERTMMVFTELFPNPRFMRWWSSLARRSRVGLIMSYPLRWGWLAIKLPVALREILRARRRHQRPPT
jgi:hypothetical protein